MTTEALLSLVTTPEPKIGSSGLILRDKIEQFHRLRSLPIPAPAALAALAALGDKQVFEKLRLEHGSKELTLESMQVPGMSVRLHP